MYETASLARFAATVTIDDIPAETAEQLKLLLLDQLCCQLVGSTLPWCRPALEMARQLSVAGPSRVVGTDARMSVDQAAFVMGTFGHGNETDDVHMIARTHPGSVIFPAALAVGQMTGASGSDVLRAVAVGYEVMLRLSLAAMPSLMEERNHHTPVAVGPFGAAVTTATLLGLDAEQIQNALGIAGSHSGGLMEYSRSGGSVKRIHPGIAAAAGVRSALLAAAGLTGPSAVIEGERGFLAAFAGKYDETRILDRLGSFALTDTVSMKRFSGNFRTHAPLEAAARLTGEIGHGDIRAVRLGVTASTRQAVGAIVAPRDVLAAQFSIRFAVAAACKYGPDELSRLTETVLRDPEVLDLAERIEVYVPAAAAIDHDGTDLGCELQAETYDGRSVEIRIEAPVGAVSRPMTAATVREKFDRLVVPIVGDAAPSIAQSVSDLESLPDLTALIELATS